MDDNKPQQPDEWKVPLLDVEEERPEGQSLGGFSHTPYAAMEMLFTHLGIGAAGIIPKADFAEYAKTAVRSKGANPLPQTNDVTSSDDVNVANDSRKGGGRFALANRDIVVDLGCGDGRANVLAAGPIYRARGIGIDIDVDLIDRFQKKGDSMYISDRLLCVVGDAVSPMQLLFGTSGADEPLTSTPTATSEAENELLPLINALDNEYIGKTHPAQLNRFLAVADMAFPPNNADTDRKSLVNDDEYNHSPIIDDLKLIFLYIGQHRQPLIFPALRELKKRRPDLIFSTAFPFNDIRTIGKTSSEVVDDNEPVAPIDVLPTGHITYYIYDRVPKVEN